MFSYSNRLIFRLECHVLHLIRHQFSINHKANDSSVNKHFFLFVFDDDDGEANDMMTIKRNLENEKQKFRP